MNEYTLIGYPLGHSLSPFIHSKLFASSQKTAQYGLMPFPAQELPERLSALRNLDGFNVTIPYKQAMIPHLDRLSEKAAFYGAVNTIHLDHDKWVGYNTDCDGFLQTMSSHKVSLQGKICILGAGGVGRMFALECARQGAQVTLLVRQSGLEKANALASEAMEKTGSCIRICTEEPKEDVFDLLINATPVGMYPNVDASPVTEGFVQRVSVVFDCIYNPTETVLLQQAKKAGKQIVGGMDMLVWQAAAAHTIWYGACFSSETIAQIIAQAEQHLQGRQSN